MIMMAVFQLRKMALSNMPKAGSISKMQSWEKPGSCAPLVQSATDQALVGVKCQLPFRPD